MAVAPSPLEQHRPRASGSVLAAGLLLITAVYCVEVEINGTSYDWSVVGRFVMPGDSLRLGIRGSARSIGWAVQAGELTAVDSSEFRWVAPSEAGLYRLTGVAGGELVTVNAFVMVPADEVKDGRLNGYLIGRYPRTSRFPNFAAPSGFVEVRSEHFEVPVSPRYRLSDFASRQTGSWPRYLVLREELVRKLELLTDYVLAEGHRCDKLTVFSGFRTPAVMRSRGSPHSAHIYGGAADLYVDGDGDGVMDDLNGDGAVSAADARQLAGYVEDLEAQHTELVGGIGWYRSSRSLGPFVQIDVRGESTRWHQ